MSLPGGYRRGTSGADAGCLSLRTVSSEELNRRALAGDKPENATAELGGCYSPSPCNSPTVSITSNNSSFRSSQIPSSTSSMLLEDVVQTTLSVNKPAPTTNGVKKRRKWSPDINKYILRKYLEITKLETDTKAYLTPLYENFSKMYPDMNDVTRQRLGDQRRAIMQKKLLPQSTIDQIYNQVKKELQNISFTNTQSQNSTLYISSSNNTGRNLKTPTQQARMKWTKEHNEAIIRAYYKITQLESNITAYGQPLHQAFIDTFPHLAHISEQRIADQRRLILNNNYVSKDKREAIKKEVAQELNRDKYDVNMQSENPSYQNCNYSISQTNIHSETIQSNSNIQTPNTQPQITPFVKNQRTQTQHTLQIDYMDQSNEVTDGSLEKELLEKLRETLETFTDIIPETRPKLPRLRENKELYKLLNIFNQKILHKFLSNDTTVSEVHTLIYCTAMVISKQLGYKVRLNTNDYRQHIKPEKQPWQIRQLELSGSKNNSLEQSEIPDKDDFKNYWADLWEKSECHNERASWIKEEERKWDGIEEMEFLDLTKEDIEKVTRKMKNWKAAGPDGIQNFWLKKLSFLHEKLAKKCTELIKGEAQLPDFLAKGITHMLPKSADTSSPSQYRPITCLPTLYKLITSCISNKINSHIESNNILAEEQKGCRQGHRGCKEQLIIDSTILKQAHKHNRNLHVTYIDYKKAFDSVPHSWLIRVLQIYKVNPTIITFLEDAMTKWKTTLSLSNGTFKIITDEIHICNGIFQGDSLSPLWFCLALNPLSHLLNQVNGYNLSNSTAITHLMYMDDIKLYGKSEKDMEDLLTITANFSKDIHMTFGLDKCKTLHIHNGNILTGDYNINNTINITAMDINHTYKYLGIQQNKYINHTQIKKELTSEYLRRVNIICRQKLNSRNLFKALNTYAVPILTYSFAIIKWTNTDISHLQIKTRTSLTKHKYLHPKSAIERMTIKREKGGRGLVDLKILLESQINNMRIFFYNKTESSIHKAVVEIDDKMTPLNLKQTHVTYKLQNISEKEKLDSWRQKQLHGRHIKDLEQQHIDSVASNKWLKLGYLFPETEGFLISIQDQVINTKNYRKHIIKDPSSLDDRCRKCHKNPETIQHIINACPLLTQNDYTHRHNQIVHYVHQKLAIKYKLLPPKVEPYYQYTPKAVLESPSYRMYFDRAILTDKTIYCNRPDITVVDKANKTAYLIDIAVPNTHNIKQTIADKIHKYSELKEEILRIWNLDKVYIVPLVLSSTGVIPNHLHHSIKLLQLPENAYITMQKAAILNTCRIVRRFLQDEPT
ncbi:uncharacterized protein LOC135194103 [Vanessa tameamea]|uniref:Uncharacterized protein LOC135194103 n=1 Tax=Vanessa tameamea TaxID=334116 RepID=A0ABM4AU21_VANTA